MCFDFADSLSRMSRRHRKFLMVNGAQGRAFHEGARELRLGLGGAMVELLLHDHEVRYAG